MDILKQHIIACIWDFDKTLIKGYMQTPLFQEFGVDEKLFWEEVNMLPEIYAKRGVRVSPETVYLNHLLSFVKSGKMRGLGNSRLRAIGAKLEFCDGMPACLGELKKVVKSDKRFKRLDLKVEHYIISTGLAEMIRGSKIARHVDGIFGCEFVEDPVPPYFSRQNEFEFDSLSPQISQIGMMVDNTIKTRFIFEINKGVNRNPAIDVNAQLAESDRRIPIRNMIYIADGPSDVPVFSVVRRGGGKTFAVYTPGNEEEFSQNDMLLSDGRIDSYGPNVYTSDSPTAVWLKMHVRKICERILKDAEVDEQSRLGKVPRHINPALQKPGAEASEKQIPSSLFPADSF